MTMNFTRTERGFELLEFEDLRGDACSLQQSSIIGDYEDSFDRPGTSAVWLGINDAKPQIMAADAAAHGVKTFQSTGWVPFPIPDEVLLSTRMELDREQARELAEALLRWCDTGSLQP